MKVNSPVGEYEYRVTGFGFARGTLRVDGSLGVWETTMEVEPSDWAALGRRLAAPAAGIGLALLVQRRFRRRRLR